MQFYFSSNCFIFTLLASIVIKDIFSWVRKNHSINRVLIWKHAVVYKSFVLYLPFRLCCRWFFFLFLSSTFSCRCFCIQVSWWKHFLRYTYRRKRRVGRYKNDRIEKQRKFILLENVLSWFLNCVHIKMVWKQVVMSLFMVLMVCFKIKCKKRNGEKDINNNNNKIQIIVKSRCLGSYEAQWVSLW